MLFCLQSRFWDFCSKFRRDNQKLYFLCKAGIRYASSVKKGHASCVFFADQSNLVGTPASGVADDGWLRLADTRHRWFEPP